MDTQALVLRRKRARGIGFRNSRSLRSIILPGGDFPNRGLLQISMCGSSKRKEDIGTAENSPKKRKRSLGQSPFLKLPPELCIQILGHLRQMTSRESFLKTRLLCRRMNSLIVENRNIFGQTKLRRIVVAQHDYFAECPKRFVIADPSKVSLSLDSCPHAEIYLVLFFKVSLESYKVEEIIQSVRKNHIKIHKMVFYGVYFAACEANLMLELFKASDMTYLLMVECKLSRSLEETLRQRGLFATERAADKEVQERAADKEDRFEISPPTCYTIHRKRPLRLIILLLSVTTYCNTLTHRKVPCLQPVSFVGNSYDCRVSGGYGIIIDDPWIYNFLRDQKDTGMWSQGISK